MTASNIPMPNSTQHRLILAASKAAGLTPSYDVQRGFMLDSMTPWNPLESSGDALLIAEKLIMSFQVDRRGAKAWLGEDVVEENNPGRTFYADLRLAIVRLAAKWYEADE